MADKIEGMSIGLSLDSAEMERGLKSTKDRLKTVNSEMKSTMSQFDRGDQSVGKYETRLQGLNKKLRTQEQVTQKSKEEYERMVQEYGEGSKQAEKAEKAYNDQSAALNNLNRYVNNATDELEEMKRQQKIANSGWTKSGKKITQFGDKISNAGGKMQGFGKKWTKVTGIAAGAAAGLGSAIFGLTNKITENADAIAKGADKMGVSTDFYQEMDYWAGQNGISQDNMSKAMERLNQRIGRAADGNEKYTKALKALDIDMNKVRDGTLSTEDAMAQSIQTLSEMDSQQERSAKASELFGTKLSRELMPALQDGSLSMEDAKKKAEELGIVMSEDQLKASEKFQDSFDDIKRSLAAVGQEIGLSLMPYMQKAMDWVSGNLPKIKETVSNAFNTIESGIKSVVNWFQSMSPEIKKAAGLFAGIAAAIGPVSIAIGSLMKVFGPFTGIIGKAATFIGKFGGLLPALKAGFVALTGPVGLTVTAITGLVTGFTLAYKKSETFRDKINSVIEAIKGFAKQIKPMIMQVIQSVIDFAKNIGNQIMTFWQENKDVIMQAVQNIWGFIQPIIQKIFSLFKTVFPAILAVVKSVWNNIKGVIQGGLDVIMGAVKTFSGLLTGDFSKMWEGVKQIFSGAIKFVWNYIQLQFFGKILKGAKTLFTSFTGVIKNMWSGTKKIFFSVIKTIVGFFKKRFTAMQKNAKTIFGAIQNITKTAWNKIKQYIVNPIKSGVKWAIDKFNVFKSTVARVFGKIKDGVSDKVSAMIKFIKDMPGKMADGIKKGYTAIKNAAKKIGKGLLDPILSAIDKVTYGIGWVLGKVGASDTASKFKGWKTEEHIPGYAKGTDDHKGGLARVSDGKGPNKQELVSAPGMKPFLTPEKESIMNLPKGASVLNGDSTAQMMSLPKFADGGGWLQTAWNKTKGFFSKTGELIAHPIKAVKGAVSKYVGTDGLSSMMKTFIEGMSDNIVKQGKEWIKDKVGFGDVGSGENASGDVKGWISRAIRATGSPGSWKSPLATIAQKESGGRTGPSTVNTWDINAKRGTPSMGLMQTIRPTFNAHAKSGMNDIMNPVHNAVAAINYIKSRYGTPFNVPGIQALRQGKPYVGYEDGTDYVPQTGMAMLHKGEAVMPAEQNRKHTDAMKLLAMIGNNIGNQANDVAVPRESDLQKVVSELSNKVDDITNLLARILGKDTNVYLNASEISRNTYKHDMEFQKREEIKNNRGRKGIS